MSVFGCVCVFECVFVFVFVCVCVCMCVCVCKSERPEASDLAIKRLRNTSNINITKKEKKRGK